MRFADHFPVQRHAGREKLKVNNDMRDFPQSYTDITEASAASSPPSDSVVVISGSFFN